MPDATKTITWERRWNSAPSPELQNGDIIETLRAKFFGQKEKAARCYTCRESNATMKKVGTPEFEIYKTRFPEVLPCGCNYEDAMLEMWAVQKGLFANDPSVSDIIPEGKKRPVSDLKTLGKARLRVRAMLEMIFGEFTLEKVIENPFFSLI